MAKIIDKVIEDAKYVVSAAEKYPAEMSAAGTTEEDITALKAQIAIALGQDVGQKKAKENAHGATKEQNRAITRSRKIIKRVKLMATSVFRGDQQMLSLFHAKQEIPTSLKSLATELTYTKDVATTYKDRLAKKGFKDADLTNIAALETELSGKDVTQEGSLRTGKGATKQRNDAIAVLKAMVEDVRISAALAFEEDESKLNEFKTLYPHRASKKKNGTKANAKNKPAASSANSTSETKQ